MRTQGARAKGRRPNSASWKTWAGDLERIGTAHQRHYESRSTFRSLALAGGAAREDVDLLTHLSPRSASDVYTRVGVIWPRLCQAVLTARAALNPPYYSGIV